MFGNALVMCSVARCYCVRESVVAIVFGWRVIVVFAYSVAIVFGKALFLCSVVHNIIKICNNVCLWNNKRLYADLNIVENNGITISIKYCICLLLYDYITWGLYININYIWMICDWPLGHLSLGYNEQMTECKSHNRR